MTPHEVRKAFGVNAKSIVRWVKEGKLHPIKTLGGHRRYKATEVRALLKASQR